MAVMAALADNLLSLRHRTQNKNTFTKQQHDVKKRTMHLQLYLQELKDRERRAQEHNSQLLQQFEEAQDALEEMLTRTAAMKTIRREYERYLEDNSSCWQQQLQQQTQAAQIKRTVDSLSSCLRKTEENQALACTVDTSLLSQGPSIQKSVAPQVCSTQENSNYNRDNSSHHPYAQPSWLTSSFLRASYQSHNPLLSPPHTFLHPHSFLPQHFTFTPSHHQPRSGQDDAAEDPGACAAQIPPEEPPASGVSQTGEGHEETSGVPSSNIEQDGGNGSCLSPDLDIKPVRLLGSHAGSSESDRGSILVCREKTKKEKRERTQQSSSDSEKTTNKTATASESDTSSEEGNAVPDAALQSEEEAKEQTKRDEEEESRHTCAEEGSSNEESPSEKVGDQSHAEESESSGAEQESGRSDRKNKTRAGEETDHQEQSSVKEKGEDGLKNPEPGEQEETENSQSEEQDCDEEDSLTGKTEEEAKVRMEDQQGSASSQDEEEDESSEDEEGSHDEDQGEETGEESGDSEDIIISPQNKRPEQIQIISEEAEDEENKTQSSKEISDEDIENLLMPQEQTEEMDIKANEDPKVIYHNMDIFQVAKEKSKTGDKSDSDEFDHFYD